jgi:hypothetical protein
MKSRNVACVACLCALLGATAGGVFAEGAVRAGRIGAELRFDYGASGSDPIAQIGIDAEYGLLEQLTVGAGFAYVDGRMTQESCLELVVKGYLLGRPLDVFAAGALQLSFSGGLGSSGTLRAGVEWQSPWKFFLGAEAAVLLEQTGVGWMGGAFAGIRL